MNVAKSSTNGFATDSTKGISVSLVQFDDVIGPKGQEGIRGLVNHSLPCIVDESIVTQNSIGPITAIDLIRSIAPKYRIVTGTCVDDVIIASCYRRIAGLNVRQNTVGKGRIAVVTDDHVAAGSTSEIVTADATQHGVAASAGINVIDRTQGRRTEIRVNRWCCSRCGEVGQQTRTACGVELCPPVVTQDNIVSVGYARGQSCRWVDVDVVGTQTSNHDAGAASHVDQVVVTIRWVNRRDLG